uniref:Cytochrome c oxidase subunit 5B, mitochondrial n=1 Tax=Meloidogyne hapla TaxID=6305 RepID=A0A1I8B2N0_MELHA
MSQILKRLQIVAFSMPKLDGRLIFAHRFLSSIKFEPSGGLLPSADPKEYGEVPDSIEQAYGYEKKMIIARLMGDDRYEPKLFYRAENSTRDYPNLVPCHFNEKHIICKCEPDATYLMEWIIRKDGKPHRCECGHWFILAL